MNVAFWSNSRKNGVTINMAALAVLSVYEYPLNVTMIENHLDREGLGQALLGCQWDRMVHEPRDYYYAGGKNDLFIQELSRRIHRRFIDSSSVEIIEDKLTYVYQNFMVSPELFEFDFCGNMLPHIRKDPSFDNIYFIDTASQNNLSTKEILDRSDVVVVNLCQSVSNINYFFENYKGIIKKSVFLISDFKRKGPINRRYFIEKFGVSPGKVGVIPHSENLRMAAEDGDITGYIHRIRKQRKGEDNILINELRRSLFMLVDNMLENSLSAKNGKRMSAGDFMSSGKIRPINERRRKI